MKFLHQAALLFIGANLLFTSAIAGDFTDKVVQAKFEQGALQLEHSMFGKGVSGGAELNVLYSQHQWPELVESVVSKRFVSDLYYFYLGAAAEGLGHKDAALVYYYEGVAAYRRHDTCNFGFDSCRSVSMPGMLLARIDALENAEKPRTVAVKVTGLDGKPIPDAHIMTTGKRQGVSCRTGPDGSCSLDLMLQPKEELPITIERQGMFTHTDSVPVGKSDLAVSMLAYKDMVCTDLLKTGSDAQIAAVEKRVSLIDLGAKLQDTSLDARGICTKVFKKSKYLSFKLTNKVKFNENKLTSYMIGADVFDDVVKKLLLVMGVTSSELGVDGYSISVASTKQGFGDLEGPVKPVNFEFYFPKKLVESYLDRDISGQKLLDGSVILLNDDRVDLKLQ